MRVVKEPKTWLGGAHPALAVWMVFFATLGALSCDQQALETKGPQLVLMSPPEMVTAPGKKFPKLVTIKAFDPNSGSVIPKLGVFIKTETEGDDLSFVSVTNHNTDDQGIITVEATGGRKSKTSTKFVAQVVGSDGSVSFTLVTSEGIEDIPSEIDENQEDEISVSEFAEKETKNIEPNVEQTIIERVVEVTDNKVDRLLIETEHRGLELAGVPFGIVVKALNKSGLVVPQFDGNFKVTFSLRQSEAGSEDVRVLQSADFGVFPPKFADNGVYRFTKGVATIPTASGFEIRKILSGIQIHALAESEIASAEIAVTGTSQTLEILPADVARLAIVATESVAGVINIGEELKGELYQPHPSNPGGLVLKRSQSATEIQTNPPITISVGTTLILQTQALDRFENAYEDPVPAMWSGTDVHDVSGTEIAPLPQTSVMNDALAMSRSTTVMNMFVPRSSTVGFIRAVHKGKRRSGEAFEINAESGVMRINTDKPTTFVVDLFKANETGTVPDAGVLPSTALTAGEPVWLRLTATNSLGVHQAAWSENVSVTLSFSGIRRSPGWPHAEDAADPSQIAEARVATFAGLDVVDDTQATVRFTNFDLPVAFKNGIGWVRSNLGKDTSAADIDSAAAAPLVFFRAGDQPSVRAVDTVNGINGTRSLPEVAAGVKAHLKLAFNSTVRHIPAQHAALYPHGISAGTALRDYTVKIGDLLNLGSLAFDRYGNRVGLSAAKWQGSDGLDAFLLNAREDVEINLLTPRYLLSEAGQLRIDDPETAGMSDISGDISVIPGLPDRYEILTLTEPKVGTTFGYSITAKDTSGAVAENYSGVHGIRISIKDATKAVKPEFFATEPEFTAYEAKMAQLRQSLAKEVEFINGVASIPADDADAALLFFYTDENPVIHVENFENTIDGDSEKLKLMPEALLTLRAHFLENLEVQAESQSYSYAINAEVRNVFLTAGKRIKMEARGYDVYENLIGPIPVNWTNTPDDEDVSTPMFEAPIYNGNEANIVLAQDSSIAVYGTNQTGKAYVRYEVAENRCGRDFACEEGAIRGYTGIIEAQVGAPERIRVVAHPDFPLESLVAGQPFKVRVELLDLNGDLVSTYDGNINIVAVDMTHTDETSRAGFAAVKPAGQKIQMRNGQADLGDFKIFSIYDEAQINVVAQLEVGLALNNREGALKKVTVDAAAKHYLRVISTPQINGDNNLTKLHKPTVFSVAGNFDKVERLSVFPTSDLAVYAGVFDQYGNWISDMAVTWDTPAQCDNGNSAPYANSLEGHVNRSSSNKTKILGTADDPITEGMGCLEITSVDQDLPANNRRYALNDVAVDRGDPQKLRLYVVDSQGKRVVQKDSSGGFDPVQDFKLLADEPFKLRIDIEDGGNSKVTQVNGEMAFRVRLENATESDTCPGHGTPSQVRWIKSKTDENATIITGVEMQRLLQVAGGTVNPGDWAEGNKESGHFLVPKASQRFNIVVQALFDPKNGQAPFELVAGRINNLEVSPNVLDKINLRSEAGGAGDLYSATDIITINADQGVNLFAAGYDKSCNYRGEESAKWTGTEVLSQALIGNLNGGTSAFVQPKKDGLGVVSAAPMSLESCALEGGCDGKVQIKVNPGQIKEFVVWSENSCDPSAPACTGSTGERATLSFNLNIRAEDQFKNVVSTFTGEKPLSFVWNASKGPGNYEPFKPADGLIVTFVDGQVIGAQFSQGDSTKKFKAALAGQEVILKVTHATENSSIEGTTRFTPKPGPASKVTSYIEEEGALVELPSTADARKTLKAAKRHVVTAKVFDEAGNQIPDKKALWSTAGSLKPTNLSSSEAVTVDVTPDEPGEATLLATYKRISDPTDLDILSESFLNIVAGKIARFEVAPLPRDSNLKIEDLTALGSTPTLFETSVDSAEHYHRVDMPFGLKITALDVNDNVVTDFCQGNISPVETPHVCDIKVTYPAEPAKGPNNSIAAPLNGAVLKVRWANGHGVFVDQDNPASIVKPFNMRKAGQLLAITVAEASGSAKGTSQNFLIKPGKVAGITFRDRANDSAGSGVAFESPVTKLQEGATLELNAAGYDTAGNYIADMKSAWTASNQKIAFKPDGTNRSLVNVDGIEAGAVTITALHSGEAEVSATLDLDVQESVAKSFALSIVNAEGANLFSDPNASAVKAGDEFTIRVAAMSEAAGAGVIATAFSGSKSLIINPVGAVKSDLDFASKLPQPVEGENKYQFVNGIALLQGFVLTGVPRDSNGVAKKVNLVITNEDATVSGSLSIQNQIGAPGHLRILNAGTHALSSIIPQEATFELLSSNQVFAHFYDKGGNWLSNSAVNWDFVGKLTGQAESQLAAFYDAQADTYSAAAFASSGTFKPTELIEAKSGKLRIEKDGLQWVVENVSVIGSSASQLVIVPDDDGLWDATKCYKVKLEARTVAGGIATSYKGSKNLEWEVTLSDSSAYPTLIDGVANPKSKDIVSLQDGVYSFSDGEYQSPAGAFCLRDATGLNGKKVSIRVVDGNEGQPISGFVDIDLRPGAPELYGLYPAKVEAMPVCGKQELRASTDVKTYWLHETDAVGNFLRQMETTFVPSGVLTSNGVTAASGDGGISLTLTKSGTGSLQYQLSSETPAKAFNCEPYFEVKPAPARSIAIKNMGGEPGETATNPFWVELSLVDEFLNVQTEVTNSVPVKFESTATQSPYKQLPKLAGVESLEPQSTDLAFVSGVWRSGDTDFLLPRAELVSLKVSSTIAKNAFGGLIHANGLLESFREIPVKAGPLAGIQIRDGHSQDANLINQDWEGFSTVTTVGQYNFYAGENDAHGNFIKRTSNVTWAGIEGLPPVLAPQPGDHSIGVYNPSTPGSGKIQVTSNATSGVLLGKLYATETLEIKSAPASAWRVTAEKDTVDLAEVIAGDVFRFRVEGIDEEGSVDQNFTGAKTVTLTLNGVSAAPVPCGTFLPAVQCSDVSNCAEANQIIDGVERQLSINFTAGVGYIEGVALFNAEDRFFAEIKGESLEDGVSAELDVKPGNFERPLVRYGDGFGDAEKTLTADQSLSMELLAVDKYCNRDKDGLQATVRAVFDGIPEYDGYGVINEYDQFTGSLSPTTLSKTVQVSVFTPQRVGAGFFEFTCNDTRCVNKAAGDLVVKTQLVTIDPGPVANLVVSVEGDAEEFVYGAISYEPMRFGTDFRVNAGETFEVRVDAVDVRGNLAKNFTNEGASPLSFIVDLNGDGSGDDDLEALRSPAGNLPSVPSPQSGFVGGQWHSRLLAPAAFKLVKAGQNPFLIAKLGGFTGRTSERLQVDAGKVAAIKFKSEAGNVGLDYPTCAAPMVVAANTQIRLYSTGFDDEGNFTGNETIEWDLDAPDSITEADLVDRAYKKLSNYEPVDGQPNWTNEISKTFTPGEAGNWRLTTRSVDSPAVTSDFCVEVVTDAPARLQAHIIIDKNGNGVVEEGEGDQNQKALGSAGQNVTAGQCFSLGLAVVDSAGNPVTTFNDTVTLDISSNAAASSAGFKPVPTAPLRMEIIFKNGVAITPAVRAADVATGYLYGEHPIVAPGHRCSTDGSRGSFVLMSEDTAASTYLVVSDGVGVGFEDAQVNIKVNRGPVDFVALLSGGEGFTSRIVGVSRSEDTGQPFGASDSWTSAYSCTGTHEHEICITDPSVTVERLKSYEAGVPGLTVQASDKSLTEFHRFFLGAYDAGGNLLEAPAADWSTSKTSMGHVDLNGAQWGDLADETWFGQYVKADGTFDVRTDDNHDVSNANSIYFYPMKSGKGLRLAARNVLTTGGKKFLVSGRFDVTVKPAPFAKISATTDKTQYLAGEKQKLSVNFFDAFNNGAWIDDAELGLSIHHPSDLATNLDDGNRFVLPLTGAESLGGKSTKEFKDSQAARIKNAGTWKLKVAATAQGVSKESISDLVVHPDAPTHQMLVRLGAPHTVSETDGEECVFEAKVGEESSFGFGAYDRFGNFVTYIKHGWAGVDGTPAAGKQFLSEVLEMTYLDFDGTPIADPSTLVQGNWHMAYGVKVKPRKAHSGTFSGNDVDLVGGLADSFTIVNPSHPTLHNQVVNTTLPWGHGSDAIGFCERDILNIASGPAHEIAVDVGQNGGQVPKVGDNFSLKINVLDEYGNPAHVIKGQRAGFKVAFTEGTVADAPDMCATLGLEEASCNIEKSIAPNSNRPASQREWRAAARLEDQAMRLTADGAFGSDFSEIKAYLDTPTVFRQVNAGAVPQVQVCFDPGEGVDQMTAEELAFWGSLPTGNEGAPVCSLPKDLALLNAPSLEIFVSSEQGAGIFYGSTRAETPTAGTEERKFSTTAFPKRFYVTAFDKFGNARAVAESPTKDIWQYSAVTNVGGEPIDFTSEVLPQLSNWPKGSPLSMNENPRTPFKGTFTVQVDDMQTAPFEIIQADSPPGDIEVVLYREDKTTPVAVAGEVVVGEQLYFTMQLKDIQGFNLTWKTEAGTPMPTSFSTSGLQPNLDPDRAPINLPADASFVYCNGWAVIDTFDLNQCPANGSKPADSLCGGSSCVKYFPVTFFSSHGTDPRVKVGFQQPVKKVSNIDGESTPINLIPGDAHHYSLRITSEDLPPYSLNQELKYINADRNEVVVDVAVFSTDLYGNKTKRNIPDTEKTVVLRLVDQFGYSKGNLCPAGKRVTDCVQEIFFECGLNEGGVEAETPIKNCLDVSFDMQAREGEALLKGVRIDSPGDFYLVAQSSNTSGIGTFQRSLLADQANTAEVNRQVRKNAAPFVVNCLSECISRFDLDHDNTVNVGQTLKVTAKMVDYRGRVLADQSLKGFIAGDAEAGVPGKHVSWDSDLINNLANGGLPYNRKGSGFCPNQEAAALAGEAIPEKCVLNFDNGVVVLDIKINKVHESTPIPRAKITFTVEGLDGVSARAKSDLFVQSTAAYEYRITMLDAQNNEIVPPKMVIEGQEELGEIAVKRHNADMDNKFKMSIWSIDQGGNYVSQPSSIKLVPQKLSGVYENVGTFKWTTNSNEPTCTIVNGKCTMSNVYMRVGNIVRPWVQDTATSPKIANPANSPDRVAIDFAVTGRTVTDFRWITDVQVKAFGGTSENNNAGTDTAIVALDGAANRLDTEAPNQDLAAMSNWLASNVAITTELKQPITTPTWPSQTICQRGVALDGKLPWSAGVATCTWEVEKAGTIQASWAKMKMTLQGAVVTRYPTDVAGTARPIEIVPNEPYRLRICTAATGCATSIAEVTLKADNVTAYNYSLVSYDFYNNLIGANGGSFSVKEKPETYSQGPYPTDHFSFYTAGNPGVTIKPRRTDAATDYIIVEGARSDFEGIPPVTMQVFFTPGNYSLLDVASWPLTQEETPKRAAPNNFEISNLYLKYEVEGAAFTKIDVTQELDVTAAWVDHTGAVVADRPPAFPATPFKCNFVNGRCQDSLMFSLTRTEVNKFIRLTVSYKDPVTNITTTDSFDVGPIYINADLPDHFIVTTDPVLPKAGSPFTIHVQPRDQFGNNTEVGCRSEGGLLRFVGAQSSPGGHGSEGAKSPKLNNVELGQQLPQDDPNYGRFTSVDNQLFFAGPATVIQNVGYYTEQKVTFDACGVTAIDANIKVRPGDINAVFLSTVSTPPGSEQPTQEEAACGSRDSFDSAGGLLNNTLCPEVYAYMYDAYGNYINHPEHAKCTWSFQGFAGSMDENKGPVTIADISASGGVVSIVSHKDFIDGELICSTADFVSQKIHLFGGIARVQAVIDFENSNVVPNLVDTFYAGEDNVVLKEMRLQTKRRGVFVDDPTRNGPETIGFHSNAYAFYPPSKCRDLTEETVDGITSCVANEETQAKSYTGCPLNLDQRKYWNTRYSGAATNGGCKRGLIDTPKFSCEFANGVCTQAIGFDFIFAEASAVNLMLTVREKESSAGNLTIFGSDPIKLSARRLADAKWNSNVEAWEFDRCKAHPQDVDNPLAGAAETCHAQHGSTPIARTGVHIPVDVHVLDQYGNFTEKDGCKTDHLTITLIGSDTIAPDGTPPLVPANNVIDNSPLGRFIADQAANPAHEFYLTKVKEAGTFQEVQFSACGKTSETYSMQVIGGPAKGIAVTTSAGAPGVWDPDEPTGGESIKHPDQPDSVTCTQQGDKWWRNEVHCERLHAWFYDSFGNRVRQGNVYEIPTLPHPSNYADPSSCDYWTYEDYAGAKQGEICDVLKYNGSSMSYGNAFGCLNRNQALGPAQHVDVAGASKINYPWHTLALMSTNNFMDGELRCHADGIASRPIHLKGGVRRMEMDLAWYNHRTDQYEDNKRTIFADFNNMAVKEIRLFGSDKGRETPPEEFGFTANKRILFKSSSKSSGGGGSTGWKSHHCGTDFSYTMARYGDSPGQKINSTAGNCPNGNWNIWSTGHNTYCSMTGAICGAPDVLEGGLALQAGTQGVTCQFTDGKCRPSYKNHPDGLTTQSTPIYLSWIAVEANATLEAHLYPNNDAWNVKWQEINVDPGPVDHLYVQKWPGTYDPQSGAQTAPGVIIAGKDVQNGGAVTVTSRDQFNNNSISLCESGSLRVLGDPNPGGFISRGTHGATPTAPKLPKFGSGTPGQPGFVQGYSDRTNATWTFAGADAVVLYDARPENNPQNIIFKACEPDGFPVATSRNVTVNEGDAMFVYVLGSGLSTSEPADCHLPPPATLPSSCTRIECNAASPASCTLFGYAYDNWGNWVRGVENDQPSHYGWTCDWSYQDNLNIADQFAPPQNDNPAPNRKFYIVNDKDSALHGYVTCSKRDSSGALREHTVEIFAPLAVDPQISCTNWGCDGTDTISSCTVTNPSAFPVKNYMLSLSEPNNIELKSTTCPLDADAICNEEQENCGRPKTCTMVFRAKSEGVVSGKINVDVTTTDAYVNNREVKFNRGIGEIAGGSGASPSCEKTISLASARLDNGGWRCDALDQVGELRLNLENNHGVSSVSFDGNSFEIIPPDGSWITDNSCLSTETNSGTVGPDQTCNLTIQAGMPNALPTLTVTPTTSGYSPANFVMTSVPNCTAEMTAEKVDIVEECSGPLGSKRLRFSVWNQNSITTASLGATTTANGGIVAEGNDCAAKPLAPGERCTFDATWSATGEENTLDVRQGISVSDPFFSSGTSDALFDAALGDNSCPNYQVSIEVDNDNTDCAGSMTKVLHYRITNPSKFPLAFAGIIPRDGGEKFGDDTCLVPGHSIQNGESCVFSLQYTAASGAIQVDLNLTNPAEPVYWPSIVTVDSSQAPEGVTNSCAQ